MKRTVCLALALVLLLSLGVQAFADDVLYCRMCGKKIPADSKVCQYCGEKVIHTDSAAAGPFAPVAALSKPADSADSSDEAAPAASTETKSAPSPATAATVPGPFNTTLGGSAASGNVRVTKSPTSESVPYGGSCLFIAHAANAASITWYIANSDASIITTAAEAPSRVSGLYVSGANSDTLSLSGIPSWMNGCQVQACFTGEGGPVYTEIARIWTYQPVQEPKCAGWTWLDWFKFYFCNDPYYWDYPWYWYNYWMEHPHSAPPWFHPETETEPATVIHVGHDGPSGSWGVGAPLPIDDEEEPPQPGGPQPAPPGFNPGGSPPVDPAPPALGSPLSGIEPQDSVEPTAENEPPVDSEPQIDSEPPVTVHDLQGDQLP